MSEQQNTNKKAVIVGCLDCIAKTAQSTVAECPVCGERKRVYAVVTTPHGSE